MFRKKTISIDIGTHNTKIIIGKEQGKGIFVEDAFAIPTPVNSFENGIITSHEVLVEKIEDLLKTHKIKANKVIFTVDSNSMIMRELVIPSVKEEELESMIKFEIEQYLPITLEEYVIEHRVLEEINEEDIKKTRILVAALPKEVVESYLELAKGLKLKPLFLDVNTNAISKFFENKSNINIENYSLDKTVVIIDLGHSYLNVNIIENGLLKFNRMIQQGGKEIDLSIANSYNLSIVEAENKKKENGSLELSGENLTHPSMINEIIKTNVDNWIIDLQKIFRYYTSRQSGNKIDEIYLYGGNSNIVGISKYFENSLRIPTFIVGDNVAIKCSKELEKLDIGIYLNAAAAIIRR